MIAVALIDGQVLPEQYSTERIRRDDVQSLLRKVVVTPDEELSQRFPREHACRLRIRLRDGRVVAVEKRDYEGFHTRPMRSESVIDKFERLGESSADAALRKEIVSAVANLGGIDTASMVALLEQVGQG